MVKLGDRVKDSITGFMGIAIGKTEGLHGCMRFGVEPEALHEGKPIEAQWFDDQRLELVEELEPPVSKDSVAESGGPHNDPTY